MAVVHHTASSNDYAASQVPAILRSMQAFHMDTNGWSDIAYNFLVDRFGTIWEGRGGGMGNAVIGAHAMGFNTGSVGVSVIGNFVGVGAAGGGARGGGPCGRLAARGLRRQPARARPTSPRAAPRRSPRVRSSTAANVMGHRDVGATCCPGSIYESLQWIRNRARNWYDWTASLHNPIGRVDGVTGGDGRDHQRRLRLRPRHLRARSR